MVWFWQFSEAFSQILVRWFWTGANINIFENRSPPKCRNNFWRSLVQKWDFAFSWEVVPKKCPEKLCFFWHASVSLVSTLSAHYSEGREWGVGSVVVESAFLGHPDFQSRGPETLILKGFGAIWGKNLGRPKRRSNDHGSNAPFSAL